MKKQFNNPNFMKVTKRTHFKGTKKLKHGIKLFEEFASALEETANALEEAAKEPQVLEIKTRDKKIKALLATIVEAQTKLDVINKAAKEYEDTLKEKNPELKEVFDKMRPTLETMSKSSDKMKKAIVKIDNFIVNVEYDKGAKTTTEYKGALEDVMKKQYEVLVDHGFEDLAVEIQKQSEKIIETYKKFHEGNTAVVAKALDKVEVSSKKLNEGLVDWIKTAKKWIADKFNDFKDYVSGIDKSADKLEKIANSL